MNHHAADVSPASELEVHGEQRRARLAG
jgi:hypothetical protein